MARIIYVYDVREKDDVNLENRQIPIPAGENLMMLMDLKNKGLAVIDKPTIKGKELEEFRQKFNILTPEELKESLEIDGTEFMNALKQWVHCVGCRRIVERLFGQLTEYGWPTLDPLVLNSSVIMTIAEEKLETPQALGTLLYRQSDVLNVLIESKAKNKNRCVLHSLDMFRARPFSEMWQEMWTSMRQPCRVKFSIINKNELREVLENYLNKHKFCQGCRTKIEKAYSILVGDGSTTERGYVAALYANIKTCQTNNENLYIQGKLDFLDILMRRAEPEVNGSYLKQRERHAKTVEIAQEEVLTCIGMIMYERLRRVFLRLKEEERACQLVAAVGVHALYRSFEEAVEKKRGISNLELLYREMSREEKAKEQKREQKKLKKKMKKTEKKNKLKSCNKDNDEETVDHLVHVDGVDKSEKAKCSDCDEIAKNCRCESDAEVCIKSLDAGYGSCTNSHGNSRTSSAVSSPDGSVVSCSDDFCKHDEPVNTEEAVEDEFATANHSENDPLSSCHRESLTLLQMLEDFDHTEDGKNCYIPAEVVKEYEAHQELVKQRRQKLRETLKQNFADMCIRKGVQIRQVTNK